MGRGRSFLQHLQSHRAFCQFLRWHSQQFAIGPSSRIAQWATTVFDASYQEILGALCFGATLYMTSPEIRYDPPKLLDWLRQQDITFLMFVPSFCQQMLADLKVWEANPPTGAPKLLVVSRGTVEENKAMGLRSPVVLDEGFNVGRLFGATGTPMALLVDAQGNIASELAVGARAVLELASSSKDPAQPAIR